MWSLEMTIDKTGTVHQVGQIIYCKPDQLKRHPENMRRFYPAEDVQAMAASIKAARGVHQALLIVPNGTGDTFVVVDGNMRLAGAHALGSECPPLKCEVIEADRAKQLLIMARTTKHHYPKDPTSEGLHYQLLRDEGFTVPEIADAVGCHPRTIESRLRLLDLDEPVRELVATGKLSMDIQLADAINAIPDKAARVKLAQRLAAKRAGLKTSLAACEKLAHSLNAPREKKKMTGPRIQDVKIFSRLANLTFAQLAIDARLLEQAALALPPDECELSEALAGRADKLRQMMKHVKEAGNGH